MKISSIILKQESDQIKKIAFAFSHKVAHVHSKSKCYFCQSRLATWPRARREGKGEGHWSTISQSVVSFNEKAVVYGTTAAPFSFGWQTDTMNMDAHNSFPRWETVMIHEWESRKCVGRLGGRKETWNFPTVEWERACACIAWDEKGGTPNLRPIEGTRDDVFVSRWE